MYAVSFLLGIGTLVQAVVAANATRRALAQRGRRRRRSLP